MIRNSNVLSLRILCIAVLSWLIHHSVYAATQPFPIVASEAESADFAYWPGAEYTKEVPSVKAVLGYHLGERITAPQDVLRYFEALAQTQPERVKLFHYAQSWQGRPLFFVAIGSPENIAKLDTFADNMQRLSDPRITNRNKADQLISSMPASVWLQHSVHGNEISSTDAAMQTAYHLLAAKNDDLVADILANTIVFIDPLQNPDGRARFVNYYYENVGLEHSADRLSVEQNEPWPRGRSNHYLFDMNRDWLAITQPETAGRIAALNQYRPLVVIDLHEMGNDSSYFFVPSAQPINPHMNQAQIANNGIIGKYNAKHFDQFGFEYFTREIFDAFYPGYGDSWPTFYGASAATYEVASTRGERFVDSDGDLNLYRNPIQQHFVASIATLEAVADNREKFLRDYYQYQVDAINAGKKDKQRTVIFSSNDNRAGSHKLATLMAQHGVEVKHTTESFKACGKRYPAGTYVIDSAQPRGRFVKTTFAQQVEMPKPFIEEQERRRARKLDDEIYDVTAWSLPLQYGVGVNYCDDEVKVNQRLVSADDNLAGSVTHEQASVAFIVPWGDAAAGRFLTAALREGIRLKSTDEAFELDGVSYPAGSLIIQIKHNAQPPAELIARVKRIAEQSGAIVTGVDTSWVTQGPNFGSEKVVTLAAPKIAIAWDTPTSSLSAGALRYIIERQFHYPMTAIRAAQLATADLRNYDVIVLPQGHYGNALGKTGAQNLQHWVKQGGVLVTLGNATKFATDPDNELLATLPERAFKTKEGKEKDKEDAESSTKGSHIGDYAAFLSSIENPRDQPDSIAGALASVATDQEHWLSAGVQKHVTALVSGSDIYAPLKLEHGKNVAWFTDPDTLLASGHLWQENRKQLAFKPFVMQQPLGNGMVIAFTQDPTTRAYLDGLNILLLNALFRAPGHASPMP